jgi:malate dehydrogenase (oxaloacetate-decarboxylating)
LIDVFFFFTSIAECNNALIYPGLGFGAVLSQAKEVTDRMIVAGANRLAELSPAIRKKQISDAQSDDAGGGDYLGKALLSDFRDAPKVNFEIAIAVAEQAVRDGTSTYGEGEDGGKKVMRVEDVRERAKEKVWVPLYPEYEYDPNGLD